MGALTEKEKALQKAYEKKYAAIVSSNDLDVQQDLWDEGLLRKLATITLNTFQSRHQGTLKISMTCMMG